MATSRSDWPSSSSATWAANRRNGLALCRRRALMLDDLPEEVVAGPGQMAAPQPGFLPRPGARIDAFEREYLVGLLRTHGR